MSTEKVNGKFTSDYKLVLKDHGAKQSGITFEMASLFAKMKEENLIKDTDGKGLTKENAGSLFKALNKIHEDKGLSTDYSKMRIGQEFTYTADEMNALVKAAGYEFVEKAAVKDTAKDTKKDTVSVNVPKVHDPIVAKKEEKIVLNKNKFDIEVAKENLKHLKHEKHKIKRQIRKYNKEIEKAEDNETQSLYKQRRVYRRTVVRPLKRAKRKELNNINKAPVDFIINNQIGKIYNGKYYINGNEVSKAVYENAKAKAASAE